MDDVSFSKGSSRRLAEQCCWEGTDESLEFDVVKLVLMF